MGAMVIIPMGQALDIFNLFFFLFFCIFYSILWIRFTFSTLRVNASKFCVKLVLIPPLHYSDDFREMDLSEKEKGTHRIQVDSIDLLWWARIFKDVWKYKRIKPKPGMYKIECLILKKKKWEEKFKEARKLKLIVNLGFEKCLA